jgi:hypothetical protein
MILNTQYANLIAQKLNLKVRQYYDKKWIFTVKSREEYDQLVKELISNSINPKKVHVELEGVNDA